MTAGEQSGAVVSIVIISKDELALAQTLADIANQADSYPEPVEIIIVDASSGRMDHVRRGAPRARWIDFAPVSGVRVTIPHQRNAGVLASVGEIVAFTDCGCYPEPDWLQRLVAPIVAGKEDVVCGATSSAGEAGIYDDPRHKPRVDYLEECATINLAFRRSVFDRVGGFDERFEYGSDVDFSWRIREAGIRIRYEPAAIIRHDWEGARRQWKRSYVYGQARARLYAKHRGRLRTLPESDPVLLAYPLFLLGLPLTLVFPGYLLLLAIPLWRARSHKPVDVLVDHLAYGAGALVELARVIRR
jgi:glycosyltransferase involved in cell wall biosynthesis